MKNKYYLLFFSLLITCFTSCSETSNQVVKKIGDFRLIASLLSPSDLAKQEIEKSNSPIEMLDSLTLVYSESLTFLLEIAANEEDGAKGNIMMAGISNPDELLKRQDELNFNLESKFALLTNSEESISPAITYFENHQGLSNKRKMLIVFEKPDSGGDVELEFKDDIFKTGINRFIFSEKLLN